jgi:hypothetical protein
VRAGEIERPARRILVAGDDDDFADIWMEQCEAAQEIRGAWGTPKALGYLVGEKFLNYMRVSDSDQVWNVKLPLFAAEIRRTFTNEELTAYFASTKRVGALAHVATEEQYHTMRDAGVFEENAVTCAADAILFERARDLLLGKGPAASE